MKKDLTPKRKAFVQARIDMPKATLADQVLAAGYKAKNKHTASEMGGDLLKDPRIIMALNKYDALFESVIAGTAADWGKHEKPRQREIALNAAMFGYDHIHGKSTVKVESHSSVVKISINLTNDSDEPPPELLEDLGA